MSLPNFCYSKNYPLIVSGYTIDNHPSRGGGLDDYYKRATQRLSKSLIKFNLPHVIYPLIGVKHLGRHQSWAKGCSFKARLIQYTMASFKRPVLWLDADAEVLKKPGIFKNPPFDAGLCSVGQGHLITGTIYFNMKSKPLVDLWVKTIREHPHQTDETSLIHIWNKAGKTMKLKLKILPKIYNTDVHANTDMSKIIIAQYLRPDVASCQGKKPIKPPNF